MTGAIQEFLNENSQRAFPFQENGSLSYSDGTMASDVVLDFRGWHRQRVVSPPQLIAVLGPEAASYGDLVALPNFIAFYFGTGGSSVWRFLVPLVGLQPDPITIVSRISDPLYASCSLGVARATFGPGVAQIPPDARWIFESASLEPGLVISAWRNQVDSLRAIHQEADDDVVGGEVRLVGGYNMDIHPTLTGIRIVPSLGGGTLGRFTGTLGPQNSCAGILMALGGVAADQDTGNLELVGENGIEIVKFPDQHRIRIKVAPQHFGGSVCA